MLSGFPMPKELPDNLRLNAQGRSNEVVDDFERAKATIRRDLASGRLRKKFDKITQAYVIETAGRNPDVLKGDKHRDTTRADINAFVDEINEELLRQAPPDLQAIIDDLREQLAEADVRYARISDTINYWARQLIDANRTIRHMKIQFENAIANSASNVLSMKRGKDRG